MENWFLPIFPIFLEIYRFIPPWKIAAAVFYNNFFRFHIQKREFIAHNSIY